MERVIHRDTFFYDAKRSRAILRVRRIKKLKHCLIGGALGASAALAVMAAVSMRQWNVAFYWVIVAAYWGLRLWEELK